MFIKMSFISTIPYKYREDPKTLFARIGDFNLDHKMEIDSHVDRNLSSIHLHPGYNNQSFEFDAALILLSEPVGFHRNIQPICLYNSPKNDLTGRRVTATGWGMIYENDRNAAVLQKVNAFYPF